MKENITMYEFFTVLYSLHKQCTFLNVTTCAWEQSVHSNTVFRSKNESVFERIQWANDSTVHSDGLPCLVSIESAVLNECLIWMIQLVIY